jgi:uncharacterized protein YprB with RNaseH-like and TPR domain
MNPKLRCIHRHTIDEHPRCFEKGLIKSGFADEKEFIKLTGKPWYQFPGYRIGYFDIECDNLRADFGTVLSWCIKEKDGPITCDVIKKEELFNGTYDRRVVQSFVDEMNTYDIIIGYNSIYFDMPYMRAKALHYGIDFPGYGEIKHWDLYFTVKSKLCISSKSLANVCDWLGIVGKTPIDKDIWRRAKYGDPDALSEVLRHNKGDVEILEEVHNRLEFSRKWIKTSL